MTTTETHLERFVNLRWLKFEWLWKNEDEDWCATRLRVVGPEVSHIEQFSDPI